MARVVIGGFETGMLLAEGTVTGTGVTIESGAGNVRSGAYSLKIVAPVGAQGYFRLGSALYVYTRVYVKVASLPSGGPCGFISDFTNSAQVQLNDNGTLRVLKGDSTLLGTSSAALTDTSHWYLIEITANGNGGSVELKVDGNSEVSGNNSAVASSGTATAYGVNATRPATYTAYFDDVAADNAALPGPGSVVMLLPTSLNAAGGWVEGDGAGTANMAAAVATRPPPGVASASETNATNIESSTNAATDDCDMNMTTYTAAGIASGDIINAVQALIRHGEDIATNTKAGGMLIVSNPTQGSEDTGWNFGDDAGAHGAEATPGLWKTKFGTIQNAPSVTLDTAPVLRVTKKTASTRTACVDFMGIMVDYTPVTARALPLPQPSNFQNPAIF